MKKSSIVGLLIIALFFSNNTNAQVKFGVKVGGNVSLQTSIPDEFEGTPLVGPMAGVFMRIPVSNKIQIQPEVMLSYSGVNSKLTLKDKLVPGGGGAILNAGAEVTDRLTYLNIPVIIRYNISEKFAIEAGYQVGVFLHGTSKGDRNTKVFLPGFGYLVNEEEAIDKNYGIDDMNRVEMALVGGFSYEMNNGLGLSIRYQQGVSAAYKPNKDIEDYVDVTDVKNALLQVGISYTFPKK